MQDQPPPMPWPPGADQPPPSRGRSCLRVGSVGCVALAVVLGLLVVVLVLLVRFIWSLHIEQWF